MLPRFSFIGISSILFFLATSLSLAGPAKSLSKDDEIAVSVNGQPITKNMLAFLEKKRSQGMLSDPPQSHARLLDDLVTTELLYQAALNAQSDKHLQNKLELELAHKTLLSQLYVREYLTNLDIDESTLRAAYDAVPSQVMVLMESWQFDSESEANLFLQEAKALPEEQLKPGDMHPWQALSSFSFGAKHTGDLSSGTWLDTPVAGMGGWQVWRCRDKSEIEKPPFHIARDEIRQDIGQEKLKAHLATLRKQAKIETFSE